MADSISYDILIIGSGIAGLRAAISAANIDSGLRIAVISKVQVMRSLSVSAEEEEEELLLCWLKKKVTI